MRKLMEKMIHFLEFFIRKIFPKTNRGELFGGVFLLIFMCLLWIGITAEVVFVCELLHPLLGFGVETFLCYQILRMRSVSKDSLKVGEALKRGEIDEARYLVSMMVDRDTRELTEQQTIKIVIETISKNACNGVSAPILFMAIGGAPLGCLYKVISVMDSVIGYKDDRYRYFGKATAKLDDIINFIPMRIAARMMILATYIRGYDYKKAYYIYKRDRKNHKSPNSAHTKAVCAGALQIELGGDSFSFGRLHKRQTIGEGIRTGNRFDIKRAIELMYGTGLLVLVFSLVIQWGIHYMILAFYVGQTYSDFGGAI